MSEQEGAIGNYVRDLLAERNIAQAALHSCQERERVLREALEAVQPYLYHGEDCVVSAITPCQCGGNEAVIKAREALADPHRSEGDEDG